MGVYSVFPGSFHHELVAVIAERQFGRGEFPAKIELFGKGGDGQTEQDFKGAVHVVKEIGSERYEGFGGALADGKTHVGLLDCDVEVPDSR